MRKLNPLKISQKITFPSLSRKVLNTFLSVGVPFNMGLGLDVQEITPERVKVMLPEKWRRRNHVGSAHACAIALLCEVPAGLMILQKYPIDKYRFILGGLTVNYHIQGRGPLTGEVLAPEEWPLVVDNGEIWAEFKTRVTNKKGELVADGQTKWQIKPWTTVRSSTSASTTRNVT
jgi:acyl-coenzyme A thioesterase PaaI-like protein